jgi:hypothetical protein
MSPRKHFVRLVAIVGASGASLVAVDVRADATPSLNSLATPDSPAFVILGVSPTTVQRPTTPNAVAASLLSAFGSNGQTLAPNYALEVAPYWLWSHPETSFDDVAKNSFSTPIQTLTLSLATTGSGTETSLTTASPAVTVAGAPSVATTPKAALGLRTTLVQGVVDKSALLPCTKQLTAQADFVAVSLNQKEHDWIAMWSGRLADAWKNGWQAGRRAALRSLPEGTIAPDAPVPVLPAPFNAPHLPPDPSNPANDLGKAQVAWSSAWATVWGAGWASGSASVGGQGAPLPVASAPPAPALPPDTIATMTQAAVAAAPAVDTKTCIKVATSREGFVLDAAVAAATDFPSAKVDKGRVSTYSGWLTAAYLSTNLSGLGLLRFMKDNLSTAGQHTTSLDLGARAIVAVSKFGLSGESVYRAPLDANTSKKQYRVDIAADVELSEGYWFSLAGGHDFIDGSDWSKFFALANFKSTFGAAPTVVVQ